MLPDFHRLIADLSQLRPLVAAEANKIPDGGSCCHDVCYVRATRNVASEREALGGNNFLKHHGYELPVPGVMGQASRVNFAAEELARLLRERGHNAHVFYMVD